MTSEVWKDVKGYEGVYKISNFGRIRSLDRIVVQKDGREVPYKGKIRIPSLCVHGYFKISIQTKGFRKFVGVHRLVAKAFIPNPENLPFVNHKNGVKTDNRLENLEWCTASYNTQHAYDLGITYAPKGENHPKSKLTDNDILFISELYKTKSFTQKEIGVIFNVNHSLISRVVRNKRWKHVKEK
jgi:hypothetical protein